MQSAKFFSLLMDGSRDVGNIDNELFLVVWFDKEGMGEQVFTHSSYLSIKGHLQCLHRVFFKY